MIKYKILLLNLPGGFWHETPFLQALLQVVAANGIQRNAHKPSHEIWKVDKADLPCLEKNSGCVETWTMLTETLPTKS